MMSGESMSAVLETPTAELSGFRELLHLAWPLVLNNSVWTLQIFTDRALVSHHRADEFAATLNAMVFYWALFNLFFHTTGYVATFVAQYTGAGRPERIGPVVGQALYTAVIGGIVFLAIIPLIGPMFAAMDKGSGLDHLESAYFRCLCFGALPYLVTSAVNGFFIGRGDSRTVLCVTTVTLVVNAGLAACWIFGYCGFPEWGIVGAGCATATAQWITAAIGLILLTRPRHRKQFCTGECWRFDAPLFLRLLRFGLPNGVVPAVETSAFAVLILVIKWLGTVELAATNMALTLNIVAILPVMGVGQAVEVLVGRYQGENRPDLSARRAYMGLAVAGGMMTMMATAYYLIPGTLLLPFQSEATTDEIAVAKVLLRFVAFYSLFDSANLVFSFALRGAGDTRFVMRMIAVLPWVGMVLPAWLGYRAGWGLHWTWTVLSGYIALLAVIFFMRFRHGAWRSMRVIEGAGEEERSDR
jgi:MATE family multidrug resistance protein